MKKILVIDDQPEIIDMVTYMLTENGYAVEGVTDGTEGLRQARSFRPDLILCDIMMPGTNGYDVLEAARHDLHLATTPFVFLTAKSDPSDLRTGMKLGADDYLTKPFTESELVASVQAQLEKHATRQARYQQQLDLLRHGLSTMLPHELRTPLTLIIAHASLLLDDYDAFDRAEVIESLQAIKESGLRLSRLVENLLIYVVLEGDATLQLEHPYISDVEELVLDAALEKADRYQRGEDLRVDIADGSLNMHPFHLKKIVEELVDNAFKFSHGGEIVNVTLSRNKDTLTLKVTDRGQGMSEEQIQRTDVFVQFNRGRLEQQGGGLGLTVARRLTKLYNGSFEITSVPTQGTTVRVFIPEVWA